MTLVPGGAVGGGTCSCPGGSVAGLTGVGLGVCAITLVNNNSAKMCAPMIMRIAYVIVIQLLQIKFGTSRKRETGQKAPSLYYVSSPRGVSRRLPQVKWFHRS